jgi:hypothetical protein
MFRKTLLCAGIVVGFVLCFLAVREFAFGKDASYLTATLSLLLVVSFHEKIPRHRQWQLHQQV